MVKKSKEQDEKKLVVMVSSTVYGIEELLERIYTLLTAFGYEVWMSHKGTMPVLSKRSAFENCLKAVGKCDLFLGLITPHYGSGKETDDGLSITHRELREAIRLNKPRWLLAHDHVVFARLLLNHLGYVGAAGRSQLKLKRNKVLDDLRVIDMYEEAIRSDKPVRDRKGNWVQQYQSSEDAMLFAMAQFSRYQEVEEFVRENLADVAAVRKSVHKRQSRRGGQP